MKTLFKKPFTGPVLVGLIVCDILIAASAGRAESLKFSVGLIGGVSQSPFTNGKADHVAGPDFLIEGDRFSLGTSGLAYRFIETDGLSLAARLAPRFVTADPADVPGLGRLKRETAIEAGLAATVTLGEISAEIEALHDISDKHDGTAVAAMFTLGCPVGERVTVGIRAGATWMDEKLATYSFGVRPTEAGGGVPAYSVKASVIPTVGITASFAMTEKASLIGGVQAEFLPNSVKKSPIVKRDKLVSAMVGVRYAF